MSSDLAVFIQQQPLCDTHEHLAAEEEWVNRKPDILTDLFGHYAGADLVTAGASEDAMARLRDSTDDDIVGRFGGIRDAWEAAQFTGYGEAVRIAARIIYHLDSITGASLASAQDRMKELKQPGERYRLLHKEANLDHVQVDNFTWECGPDPSGPEFFLYDLNWQSFCRGELCAEEVYRETGIEVVDIPSLRSAQSALFDRYGPFAIAVKSQHAYGRTLDWQERSDGEAAKALEVILKEGKDAAEEARLCLGDWSWARGVELAIAHNLPFKIHTGYYAGNRAMPMDRIHSSLLYRLLQRYPKARFVLMHIAYPYSQELAALAKHYPNVWVDLCWAWSIDPYSSEEFVRRFLHTVPINKLFAFGGDTFSPTNAVAYASQSRKGLTRALDAEVKTGELMERDAVGVAARLMYENAYACFDIGGRRAASRRSHSGD